MSEYKFDPLAGGALLASPFVPPLPGKITHHPTGDSIVFRMAQGLCRICCSAFLDIKAYHAERVPPTGGLLLVSNHQSFLDPVIIGVSVPRSLSYMAKSELFTNPIFGGLIRKFGAFPVRQTGSAAGAIKETIDRLKEGKVLNIFPEGTRTPDGEIKPFEKGTALVVRKAQVPVVPVAIHGSFEAYPPRTSLPWPQPVTLMFGEPMELHDRKPDEILRLMEARVRDLYAELRAMDSRADARRRNAVARAARDEAEKKERGNREKS